MELDLDWVIGKVHNLLNTLPDELVSDKAACQPPFAFHPHSFLTLL